MAEVNAPMFPEDRKLMGDAVVPIVERNGPRLLVLAQKSFTDLTPSEVRFFNNLGLVSFGDSLPEENDQSKTLRADRIAWAMLDRRAIKLLTPLGVTIQGANIERQLNLVQCKLSLSLVIYACRIEEDILLSSAELSFLSLESSVCSGLYAEGIKVAGSIFLNNKAKFANEVRLLEANIGGVLNCSNKSVFGIEGSSKIAIIANNAKIASSFFLKDESSFFGSIIVMNATVGGNIECEGSKFISQDDEKIAICADGINVGGSIFFGGEAIFIGNVRLPLSKINNVISCIGGTFRNEDGYALGLEGAIISGSVFMGRNCDIHGHVEFANSRIGGFLCMGGLKANDKLSIRLSHASVDVLWDDKDSWPISGKLWLDGFHYGRLVEEAEWDLNARLDWLSRHNTDRFNPQPYEQLAKVYRDAGLELDARDVLIVKNDKMLEAMQLDFTKRASSCPRNKLIEKMIAELPSWCKPIVIVLSAILCSLPNLWLRHVIYWVLRLLGKVCAHGYKPGMAVIWWIRIWVPSCIIVWLFNALGWIVPTYIDLNPATNSTIGFSAPGYAFDLMTPIFDMGYTMAWTPDWWPVTLILLAIGTAGYILVALFAASITGLIRR